MLKVHARKLEAVEVLSLEGQIVSGDTETLWCAVQLADGISDVVLDLSNVSAVDAHGLGVLLQLREQTLANGIHFELMNVNEPVSRVFKITRLDTVFEINSGVQFLPDTAHMQHMPVAA